MPRKPKIPVTAKIPSAFVDFMQEVDRLIVAGDESAMVESDDLLQCDCVYGGLFDVEALRYGFTYFHGDREGDATWTVLLDATQIAGIAKGEIDTLSLWQCSSGTCDCLYPTEDYYCPNCDSIHDTDDYRTQLRVQHPDESEDTLKAMENLGKVNHAIIDYQDDHDGRFPPPFTTDSSGVRLHSWRSLILPYLDLEDIHALIDFGQPWDADVNRAAAEKIPEVYAAAQSAASHTHVFAVVSPDTLWPEGTSRRMSDVQSGTSYTIAIVYSQRRSVHWMEPRDLDLDWMTSENNQKCLVAFMDGTVDTLSGIGDDDLRKLFQVQ